MALPLIVGWFIVNGGCITKMNESNFPFQYYTHIVTSKPFVTENGTAICIGVESFTLKAHSFNRKLIWRDGIPHLEDVIFNASWQQYRSNYLRSIRTAVLQCQIDGIEFDYEPPLGIISNQSKYDEFLMDIKH